jgi:itaconate CoA-transferase
MTTAPAAQSPLSGITVLALDVFTALLERSDVLVSNLAPGALGRLGLAPDKLTAQHPRLIIVDISGYGRGGPLDHKRAYDLLVQAEAGSCAITGLPGQPAKSGIPCWTWPRR